MICITDIRKNGVSVYRYKVSSSFLTEYLKPGYRAGWNKDIDKISTVRFDLINTNNNKVRKDVDIKYVMKLFDKIVGALTYGSYYIFDVMDKDTWYMLDYINGVECLGRYESAEDFYESLGNTNQVRLGSNYDILIGKDDTYVISLVRSYLKPIDKNNIFWYNDSTNNVSDGHFTVFDFYLTILRFDGLVITPNTKVYAYIPYYKMVYKLDINQRVVRVITKYKTLNRQG